MALEESFQQIFLPRTRKSRSKVEKYSNHSIVLDLDETLIQTLKCEETPDKINKHFKIFEDPKNLEILYRSHRLILKDPCTKRGYGSCMYCWLIERPGMINFLNFCFDYFQTVNVWTAGKRSYGETIAESIFKPVQEPHHIFTQDDCTSTKRGYVKDLDRLIERHPDVGPIKHLFILDDNPISVSTHPENAIMIPEFIPNIKSLKEKDSHLNSVIEWLKKDEVRFCEDIRTLDKNKIFS